MRFPVIARQNAPPSSPSPGQRWVIGASPTGSWAGQAHKIAVWRGSWKFITPVEGDRTYDQSINDFIVFDGTAWDIDPRSPANTTPMTHLADGVTGALMTRANLAWGQQGTGDNAVVETVSTAQPRPYWRYEIPYPGNGGDTTALRTRRDWQIAGGALGDGDAVEFAYSGMSFVSGFYSVNYGVYVRNTTTGQSVQLTERGGAGTAFYFERRGGFDLTSYGTGEDGSDVDYPNTHPQPVTLLRFRRSGSNIQLWWSMEGAVWRYVAQFSMTDSAVNHCGVILWRNTNAHCSILVLGCRRVSMP